MLRVGYAITLTIVWPFLLSDSAIAETGPSESVRFLVGELHPHHYDSYVLPLGDPAAIAHARELITDPSAAGQAIVVAKIAQGRDGVNRNYIAPGAPFWSWHVAEFIAFADITAEILDGWPGMLGNYEDDPEYACCGSIGFWSYTIVAELPQSDYDGDLDVDHDDYNVWRESFGTTVKNLGADGNGNGSVDAADYVVWRKNLGASMTLPPHLFPPEVRSSNAVPEPSTLSILAIGTAAVTWMRRLATRR
jgi:hypothetical protein